MFYQNNNDYMRDAFYYSQPQQNSTYPYGGMNNYSQTMPVTANNFGNNMNMGMPMTNSISNMYPQIYRIIDPVANRVIANNNYPYYTEDNLNNMVDTVYNIVEGDIATLSSSIQVNSSDDTVTQGPARSSANTSVNNNTRTTSTTTTEAMSRNTISESQLLKDLIKIIIIKQLLSRQTGFNTMGNMNYYDPRYLGMI